VALFSRQGYHGTTTRDIAQLAGVSEVTLFRYFESKEVVFGAALSSSFAAIELRRDLLDRISQDDAPEAVLRKILSIFVDSTIVSPELMRLIAISFLEVRGKAEEVCRAHLTPLFGTITEYLQANILSGRVRQHDPMIMATAIALTVIAQPELSKVFRESRQSTLESRRAIDEYASFWLDALVLESADRNQSAFAS
jgi:AcrR family transcriptional regulator